MADDQAVSVEDKPALNVEVEDSGPARKLLIIEVPEERIKAKIEDSFDTLRDDAAVPGFRRGRAPRRLLEKRFGESVRDDVKGQLLSECFSQACEDNDLDMLGEPDVKDIEDIKLPESGSLTFKVEIEVSPNVKLPDFSTIEVKKEKFEVADKEINEQIEQYRERFGKATTVPDAKVEEGDYVAADVHVYAGNEAGGEDDALQHNHGTYILVPGKSRDFKGHVAGIVVDDLGKQLKDKTVGEELLIAMTGPEGHENDQIKGQPITIQIAINAVERLEPATIEQVVENLGVESEDDLRTRLKEMLEGQATRKQQTDMHRQVTDQLAEKVELELPEGLTGRQIDRTLQRQRMEMMYQGMKQEDIEQKLAEQRTESEDEARRQLKLFFIVDQAAKDLEIEVADNEINGQVAMMAMQSGRRPEKVRQEMQQRGELEQLYLQVREQKTLDKIIEQAKVTEIEASDKAKEKKPAKKKSSKKKSTKKKAD